MHKLYLLANLILFGVFVAAQEQPASWAEFQKAVTKSENKIDSFYAVDHQIKLISKEIHSLSLLVGSDTIKSKDLQDSIDQLNERMISLKLQQSTHQTNERNNKENLREADSIKRTLNEFIVGPGKEIESIRTALADDFKSFIGENKLKFKGANYHCFIADLDSHRIDLNLKYSDSAKASINYSSLGAVKKELEINGNQVLMLTNGGMYTPKNEPEGLLIINSNEIAPIDAGSAPKGIFLNFYLKPNGVFFIYENKATILTTKEYQQTFKDSLVLPYCATQSGPMLLINGKHHPALNHNSKSKKLRSGVGTLQDGRIVFAITANGSVVNFHDFASLFKDVFGCTNALFLDGAISKMYLKGLRKKDLSGNFGPIISICRK